MAPAKKKIINTMSEFSSSRTSEKNEHLRAYLFSHFSHLFFSICLDPLSIFYFIFFFPYFLRILSFLAPLFITTALLFAALITVTSPDLVLENYYSEFSKSQWGYLLSVCQSYIQWLRLKTHDKDEELGSVDGFEAYLVMLQQSIFEPKLENDCSEGLDADAEYSGEGREDLGQVKEPHVNPEVFALERVDNLETTRPTAEFKSLQILLQETRELKDMSCRKEDKVKLLDPEFSKIEESREKLPLRSGYGESNWENSRKVLGYNQALCSNLGNFGLIRKEREWRRTLACKLFEERHNASGSEGMDMLWETYEIDSAKFQQKSDTRKENKSWLASSEEDKEEELGIESKLCCLQALKLSAGKMNLGLGRPNFLKISKALKGIGWLHHDAGRHGKNGKQ